MKINPKATPILFLVFNRPDLTEIVFNRIRLWQPEHLYIAADGPRSDVLTDAQLTEATRAIVKNIDWDCKVHYRFSDDNQGCLLGVTNAISWFFAQVEAGIILEDDCLPSLDFFPYCAQLLERYQDCPSVMHIGATTPISITGIDASYYFSKYNRIWGWATWRRAWQHFDPQINRWPTVKAQGLYRQYFDIEDEYQLWISNWDSVREKQDTWDYQWFFCRLGLGLGIIPGVNLVSNLGFREDATRTVDESSQLANMATEALAFPLSHPAQVQVNSELDRQFFIDNIYPRIRHLKLSANDQETS